MGSHHSRDGKKPHINWTQLQNKLGAVAASRETCPSSPSISSHGGNSSGAESDVDLEYKRKRMKAKEFELHRKAHYNEMEALRKWRSEHQNVDDDEDDE
jgi:Protein phosphatase inhibitor 2 (IPP-2).